MFSPSLHHTTFLTVKIESYLFINIYISHLIVILCNHSIKVILYLLLILIVLQVTTSFISKCTTAFLFILVVNDAIILIKCCNLLFKLLFYIAFSGIWCVCVCVCAWIRKKCQFQFL